MDGIDRTQRVFPEPRCRLQLRNSRPGLHLSGPVYPGSAVALLFRTGDARPHHGTIQPQTAEPLRSARRRLLARNGFRTPHGICFPAGVAKGPAVLPADGNSALHPIHRRLLPLRPDSHRPLLHPLLPGDRPGLLVHGAHPPAMAAVDVGTAGLLPAFLHPHHCIHLRRSVHNRHLPADARRLGNPLRLYPPIPYSRHHPELLANAAGRRNHGRKPGNHPGRRKPYRIAAGTVAEGYRTT